MGLRLLRRCAPRNDIQGSAGRQRFGHWCFEFWICFGFRISCLEFRVL
jgi:hypothetical protein